MLGDAITIQQDYTCLDCGTGLTARHTSVDTGEPHAVLVDVPCPCCAATMTLDLITQNVDDDA